MIHLDTNALVALPLWAREGHPVIQRIAEGEPAGVSAVVWYEFLIGPVAEEEIRLAHAFLRGTVIPLKGPAIGLITGGPKPAASRQACRSCVMLGNTDKKGVSPKGG